MKKLFLIISVLFILSSCQKPYIYQDVYYYNGVYEISTGGESVTRSRSLYESIVYTRSVNDIDSIKKQNMIRLLKQPNILKK
jgi:hypothetical protein